MDDRTQMLPTIKKEDDKPEDMTLVYLVGMIIVGIIALCMIGAWVIVQVFGK